jgi:hypothetical protein
MKKIALLSLIFVAMLGLNSFAQVGNLNGPLIQVDKDVHDYGSVEYGANGTCTFTVTNTGNAPLIISNCVGSCGCTVPACSSDPIMPGASTKITVKYDTNREGMIDKTVTITSNAVNFPQKEVKIKGTVKPNPAGAVPPTGVNN